MNRVSLLRAIILLFMAFIGLSLKVGAQNVNSLSSIYNNTKCGLNYIQTSHKITSRHVTGGAGIGLPAVFAMNGLPATCVGIEKAYIWYVVSYTGVPATLPKITVTNPTGTVFNYTAAIAGTAPEKCWQEIDTRTYRIDVTSSINGNGNYRVTSNTPATDIDGMTFFIVYSDANATYQGSIIISDGAASTNMSLGVIPATLSGFTACGNSTTATAFQINSDFQLISHNATLNGATFPFVDAFYNYDQIATSVTAGQTTSAFSATATGAVDCFSLDMIGLYYQTTSCTNCNQPLSVSSTTVNPTTCGLNNGSATVNLSTAIYAPYLFLWTPGGQTTQTAINLAPGVYNVAVSDLSGCKTTNASVTIDPSTGPKSTNTTVSNANCGASDGSFVVNLVNGGVAPISYNFNGQGYVPQNSFSNLAFGNYTLSIQDVNGCQFDTMIAVANNGAPTAVVLTKANTFCGFSNGSVMVGNVTGGIAPYTYSVDNGTFFSKLQFDSLFAGNHIFKVKDASGCMFSTTFTLTNTPGPTAISRGLINTTCGANNGSVSLGTVTGGTAPFMYNFNNLGFTNNRSYPNLFAGTYSIDVRDVNQCVYSTSVTIIDNPGPTAIAYLATDDTCALGNASIQLGKVSGGKSPYQFDFDNTGFSGDTIYSGLSKGNYPLVVMDDNGCMYLDTIALISIVGPSSVQASSLSDSCDMGRGSVLINLVGGGTNPYVYNFNNLGYSSNTEYQGLKKGNYSLTISDNYGCLYDSIINVAEIACEAIPEKPEALVVPEGFSPNGDGNNDIFIPYYENIVKYELLIFNRWGERIFESKRLDLGWNGTSAGEVVLQGVYVYLIKATGINGKIFNLKGILILAK